MDEKEYDQHIENAKEASHVEDIDNLPVSWFVWVVAVTASIAGLLFGYDTGIISAVLVYIGTALNDKTLSSNEKELVTSLCSGGAFFGAIMAGLVADKLGRKSCIYIGCVLFTVGAVIQGSAYTIVQMAVGRAVVGLGVGSAAMVVPLYVAEIAPAKARGRLIGLNNISITGGQVVAYAVGAGLANVSQGWRYMVGLGAVPSIILACMLPFCPESPRHLVFHGKLDEAEKVLERIYATASREQIQAVKQSIIQACDEAKLIGSESRWSKIKQLHTIPANARALFCACGLMVISQMSGFNTLMYYSSTLFSLVGFNNPTAVGLVVAGTNLIMTFVNVAVIDKMGRRKLLLSTTWGMSAGLIAIAIAFAFIPVDTKTMTVQNATINAPAIVVLVFVIWFVVFYGVSVGNTAWMSADFFPLEVRAMGTMWMSCSNWATNVIVSSTFLSMMQGMTPSGTFGFYAGICGAGTVWIYLFYPEVTGLPLEEIRDVFERGIGKGFKI